MNSTNDGGQHNISLNPASGVPVYRQIIQQIEQGIISGRLRPGDRLPTIRQLAVTLKVNPNTIAKAYGELEIRDVVVTQVGSGTYISDKKPAEQQEDEHERNILKTFARFLTEMTDLGVSREALITMLQTKAEEEL